DSVEGVGELEPSVAVHATCDVLTRFKEPPDLSVLRNVVQESRRRTRYLPLLSALPPPRTNFVGLSPLLHDRPSRRRAVEDTHPELLDEFHELLISRTRVIRVGAG